jgi:hypothetical protein
MMMAGFPKTILFLENRISYPRYFLAVTEISKAQRYTPERANSGHTSMDLKGAMN